MKISGIFPGFNISAKGLRIQRKKMDLIAENIANADNVRDASGQPYKRKFLQVQQIGNNLSTNSVNIGNTNLRLKTTDPNQISNPSLGLSKGLNNGGNDIKIKEMTDNTPGQNVYMPESPDADPNGYVQTSNVNIITEMTDMIVATRGYEANLTALNSSKQMIKDSLDI